MKQEAIDVLLQRHSTRDFQPKQISDDEIDIIVHAGLNASTAMNRQSWHLTVVQNRELLQAISGAVGEVLIETEVPSLIERARSSGFSSFHHAPTVIFVSGDGNRYSMADCANATQNMCNAAFALGIGSCYIGSFVQAFNHPSGEKLLTYFDLPHSFRPAFAVALGYPNSKEPPKKDRKWKVSYIK